MKNVFYHSTDKLYKISKNKLSNKALLRLSVIFTITLLILSIISFNSAVKFNAPNSKAEYNETGKVDYKVYLKDNDYYDSSFLNSGMQYVASLIKTINVKFDYQMHLTKDIALDSKYRVVGVLQITERDEPSKILYTKEEEIVPLKTINVNDDNFVISEEVDIDYDKYNEIVNTYKSNLGLFVSSNLILTLETDTNGTYEKDKFNKKEKLQITIPLSESTLQIKMNSTEINNNGTIGNAINTVVIDNGVILLVFIGLSALTILSIMVDIRIYLKYVKEDIYKSKVNKILRDYDRLIVNGKINVNEENYDEVIIIEDFKEMVDAAQNLNLPILFYETIPNEKCFFVIIADKILYKYRLTKAYLEKHENNKQNNIFGEKDKKDIFSDDSVNNK